MHNVYNYIVHCKPGAVVGDHPEAAKSPRRSERHSTEDSQYGPPTTAAIAGVKPNMVDGGGGESKEEDEGFFERRKQNHTV